jgi:putative phage-type endonuclease
VTHPRVLAVDPNDHAQWLAARRRGIGSSDVAAILGMSKFATPYSVWVDKVEGLPEDESPALEFGRRLEAVVADAFADRHPEFLVFKPSEMYAHGEFEWMLANPDRLLWEDGDLVGVLEVKTSNYADDWSGDEPPDYVLLQVQHQLAVMDLPFGIVALLMFGREYREFRVERDERVIAMLVDLERDFWRRVEEHDPPPVDESEVTEAAIKWLYREPDPETVVELGDDGALLLEERAQAKRALDEAERAFRAADNALKARLGNRTVATVRGEVAATWNVVVRQGDLDVDALAADHPELVQKYRRPATTYRRLHVKKAWA